MVRRDKHKERLCRKLVGRGGSPNFNLPNYPPSWLSGFCHMQKAKTV